MMRDQIRSDPMRPYPALAGTARQLGARVAAPVIAREG